MLGELSSETPQFLALYSFSSSSLKASVHSSRLPFDEAGWRKFQVKPARANGLRLEGRLTSRVKHPSHPGWGVGGGVPQNKGACFPSSKALEGTAVSWALCGPSVPNLGPPPPHMACFQNCPVLHYVRILNCCTCSFSETEQEN